MSISKKVVGRPVLFAVIFGLVAIMGFYSLGNLAIDLFPEINMPIIMVQATYEGADPSSVEESVTKVLESGLVNLSGLEDITSTSSEDSASIKLEFKYGTNLDAATNDIRDKIDRVKDSLPDEVSTPTIMKFDPDSMPIIKIAVRGNRTPEDLKEIAEDYIQPRFEQASGVAQASVSGGRDKIVRVELSQNRLDAYDLTLNTVASSLASQNLDLGGGNISEGSKRYAVQTKGEFKSIEEIASTVVGTKNGYGVKLSDLGEVFSGYEDESSIVYVNGSMGVYVSIMKQTGSNSVKVADEVYSKVEEVKKVIPQDVEIEVVSDETDLIRETINNLVMSAIQGGLLAMLILIIFLRSIKSTLIIGISIPFSIIVSMLAMNLFGITLNMMTMTGLILGLGMIVDASIVVLENTYQYIDRGAKATIAATLGTQEMISAIVSSNLTTICVFIPILFFKSKLGFIGQLFQDMIFTIIIALVSSLFVALFLVPVLASKYLKLEPRKDHVIKNKLLRSVDKFLENGIEAITKAYKRVLIVALKHRLTTVLIVVGLLVISIAVIPRMHISLMPRFGDSSVTLNVALPIGTRYEETKELMLQFESIAEENIKGYKTIITNVGTGSFRQSENNTYKGSLFIQLEDEEGRVDSAEDVQRKLREHFDDFPNATFTFGQGRMGQMAGYDIDIAIRTQDLDIGLDTANELVTLLKQNITDLSEPEIDLTEGLPQVQVIIDRERAYSFGVNVSDVAQEINASLAGTTATTFRNAGKEYSVVVMLKEEDRSKIPDLEQIYVTGTSGRVSVANFASFDKGYGPVSISRENQSRMIHITADIISNLKANEVEAKIQKLIEESMILPDNVSISFEGSWKDVKEQSMVFLMIFSMALLLVFGVMAGQYESFKDPLINLFTIPLIIIGVVAIYFILGETISMFTLVGVVMLVGIVVNNGIILVDYTNLLVSRGVDVHMACINAGASRLRPVLMTTLTTTLGMVPMAFSTKESAMMIQPIGLTVIGGLISSTFITLFFIPVIYSFFNEKKNKKEELVCAE